MAAGHGGQILVSEAAAAEIDGNLPSGVTLRDLGIHRLKDLTLPEHLYQVLHDDLPSDFPPPSTLDARPHNLPQQATEFLGRADELTAIQIMLDSPDTRLLTIAGPGGAGKTRLGLQVAAEQVDRFRDGVFFIDLSAEREPVAAYEAIARGLDLPITGGNPLLFLEARLRDRQIMLMLDNFEQVTAAAVGLSELLQHAPGLKILVTSRETLRIRAEKVFPVPPLSLPHPASPAAEIAEAEAVRLFTDRARSVQPGFTITEGNASRHRRDLPASRRPSTRNRARGSSAERVHPRRLVGAPAGAPRCPRCGWSGSSRSATDPLGCHRVELRAARPIGAESVRDHVRVHHLEPRLTGGGLRSVRLRLGRRLSGLPGRQEPGSGRCHRYQTTLLDAVDDQGIRGIPSLLRPGNGNTRCEGPMRFTFPSSAIASRHE